MLIGLLRSAVESCVLAGGSETSGEARRKTEGDGIVMASIVVPSGEGSREERIGLQNWDMFGGFLHGKNYTLIRIRYLSTRPPKGEAVVLSLMCGGTPVSA